MMRAVIPKATLQRIIVQASIVSNDDLNLEYQPEGWLIERVDAAHVAMIRMSVDRKAMDEYEPASRPIAMANAKSRSVSPPNSSIANTGMNDESVVLIVRMNTWLIEWFAIVMNVQRMLSAFMLSLMRWNTTTVS